ncbi:hypothetical protein BH11PLA2_BH11PLA2_15600 [soil metagenome]
MPVDNPDVLRTLIAVCVLPAFVGCAGLRREQAPPPPFNDSVVAGYRIGCPDVLVVCFTDRPQFDVLASVDVDGRVYLPGIGKPRLEGLTTEEARSVIARTADVTAESVTVRVSQPKASRVFISGPDNRRTRMLTYGGPEPVLDFLKRTGAIPPRSSQLNRVYVLRSNVAEGTPPRLFHVDVEAAVLDNDPATNVPLLPGDHVYIGETRRSSFSRLLPDWLKPLYRSMVGLLPDSLK